MQAVVLALAAWASSAIAQQRPLPPSTERVPTVGASADPIRVQGRVMRPADTDTGTGAMANVMVTLHRVGSDGAGPLDSVRTNASGRYTFVFQPFGAGDAVYFASASYGGVAYFTMPIKRSTANDGTADITVFDTTSRPIPISVRGRHLIVDVPNGDGVRRVTEVFELSNDTSVTHVSVGDAPSAAVWSALLPSGARDVTVAEGDIAPATVKVADGRVYVFATLSPGMRQLSYTYRMPGDAFPLVLPLPEPTTVLEVLTEEATARVEGAQLRVVQPVAIGGRHFQRFLGTDVPANAVARVTVDTVQKAVNPWILAGLTVVIGGAMLGALAYALRRR